MSGGTIGRQPWFTDDDGPGEPDAAHPDNDGDGTSFIDAPVAGRAIETYIVSAVIMAFLAWTVINWWIYVPRPMPISMMVTIALIASAMIYASRCAWKRSKDDISSAG